MGWKLLDYGCANDFPNLASGPRRSEIDIGKDIDFILCILAEALQERSEWLVILANPKLEDDAG